MRPKTFLCPLIMASSLVGVAHSRPLAQDLETVSAPGATWADEVFLVGDSERTVVVTMGRDEARPAIWRAFDAQGRELWRREHACPDFRDYAEVKLEGELATCKMSHALTALDATSGEERWRFADSRRLYMNDIEGGRVAVSINNEELAVLDAKTGERVLRLDTPGAVFQRLAPTASGPFAILVQDPPGRVERTIDVDLGDGPQKVALADVDAERRLVAVPVDGASQDLVPLKPVWSVPFEGYSFTIIVAAGTLIAEPSEGVRVGWDTQTGAQRWAVRVHDGDVAAFGRFGSVVAKNHGREWNYLGFTPGTNHMHWVESMPTKKLDTRTEEPLFLQVGGVRGVLVAPRHIRLFSMLDGKTERDLAVPHGYSVTAAHLSDNLFVYVTSREGSRRLHLWPLRRR